MEKTSSHQDEVDGKDMTKEQRDLINEEDRYRRMFAEQRDSAELENNHLLLFDVFKEDKNKWKYVEETKEEVIKFIVFIFLKCFFCKIEKLKLMKI